MEFNPIGWFEIYVEDMNRAKSFYETVFGVELSELASPGGELEMQAFPMSMECSGASGALVRCEGVTPGSNSIMIYFTCQDCAIEAGLIE